MPQPSTSSQTARDMARNRRGRPGELCIETQSREIMAILVNDVVAEAMRLDLRGESANLVAKANGARNGLSLNRFRSG